MKKNEMKLLRLAAPVFNESSWTLLNKRLTHYDRDEVTKLYFYVNKKDASISTIYLSLERDECSKIEIYINIRVARYSHFQGQHLYGRKGLRCNNPTGFRSSNRMLMLPFCRQPETSDS